MGLKLLITGAVCVTTVKVTPLLATPPTVTTTFPLVAPAGTGTAMLFALQLLGAAAVPLKVTLLAPIEAPKLLPVIVTTVPIVPEVGLRLLIAGVACVATVKATPLLTTPPTVTTTFPLVAPAGTSATMLVAVQLAGMAAVPLNVSVLPPCLPPKLAPLIVTKVPVTPEVGLRLSITGVVATVKAVPLLGNPPTVTTTFPLVAPAGTGTAMLLALQLVGVAAVPLNFTLLLPWVAPKLAPVMVTMVPIEPAVGLKLLMTGAEDTVNAAPLLANPPTVTTTLPLVAPAGTGATMLVAFQPVGMARVPLNVTRLLPCEAPKLVPVIVTGVPTSPAVGFRLPMLGAGGTVKATPLLDTPPTVTTTLPLLAPAGTGATMLVELQVVGVAGVPLNVTLLLPCEVPKLVPEMVTGVPTAAEVGFRLLMTGVGDDVTPPKNSPLATAFVPFTLVTWIFTCPLTFQTR